MNGLLLFINVTGLERRMPSDGHLGLYNGEEMIFEGSRWFAVTLAKLMWRYGWNVVRLNSFLQILSTKFDRFVPAHTKTHTHTQFQILFIICFYIALLLFQN